MTTIRTIEDLVRLLDEKPEWVDALRVRLLTRELIELPEIFAKFAEMSNRRLDNLESDVSVLKSDVSVLKSDVSVLKSDVSVLKSDVAELKTGMARLEANVGHLNGWALESRLHLRIEPLINQHLGLRRAEVMRAPAQTMRFELRDQMEDSADNDVISDSQVQRVSSTDFILRARRRGALDRVWVAVEAANKIRADDVSRALETARILTTVFGEEAVPVVSGFDIDPSDRQRADDTGVIYLPVTQDWE